MTYWSRCQNTCTALNASNLGIDTNRCRFLDVRFDTLTVGTFFFWKIHQTRELQIWRLLVLFPMDVCFMSLSSGNLNLDMFLTLFIDNSPIFNKNVHYQTNEDKYWSLDRKDCWVWVIYVPENFSNLSSMQLYSIKRFDVLNNGRVKLQKALDVILDRVNKKTCNFQRVCPPKHFDHFVRSLFLNVSYEWPLTDALL